MKIFRLTTILFAAILTLSVFPGDYLLASPQGSGSGDDYSIAKPRSQKTMTISGITRGTLEGRVKAGNNFFVITKDTRIYKSGEGPVEVGTFVVDTPVHAVCVIHKNVAYAKLVIVSDRCTSGKGVAGKLDPNEPR
jgi:hypothetical protein